MTVQTFLDGRVTLHCGDCLDVLTALRDSSVDSVVCDPPYHLVSIVKRFGAKNAAKAKVGKTGAYARASAGFMGKQWDGGDIAFRVELWTQVLRVLKPGGHLLAFSGTRTYHRMGCAIEDAGFDVRDQIGWAYGSGFPKSHNAGHGWGSALKPAWEPIVLARKQLIGTIAENVAEYGTGAINIDGCRVDTADNLSGGAYTGSQRHDGTKNWRYKNGGAGRSPLPGDEREGAALGMFQPGKTAEKEFVQPIGRWPANIVHDGSEEVLAAFPKTTSGTFSGHRNEPKTNGIYGDFEVRDERGHVGDSGSAARFFYTAKADAKDRLGSKHPTVKPLDLMQWLVRLVTPKGGTVLDPFAGTGTTGEAAWREGMNAILIEREEEYQADIARRMDLATNPTKRSAVAATKNNLDDPNSLPLFAGDVA